MKQLCQAAVSVTLQQCRPPSWALGCTRDRALSDQSCSPLNLRVLQGSAGRFGVIQPVWVNISTQAALWTSVDSELLPHYVASSAILWQLLLHDSLFLWTAQAKFRPTRRSLFSLTHQYNFSCLHFLADSQS